MYFLFNDVADVLYRWKIWTADRPIQHPDYSTTKPCNWNITILNIIYSCDAKLIFRIITPVLILQKWSFGNHSNILICCSKKFLIIINVKKNLTLPLKSYASKIKIIKSKKKRIIISKDALNSLNVTVKYLYSYKYLHEKITLKNVHAFIFY